jgi:FkbM family methyltransferase
MSLIKICKKTEKFIESIITITKLWGLHKAIRTLIFNFIMILTPLPNKEEIILTTSGIKLYVIPYDRGISRELKIFKTHEPLSTKILIKELVRLKKLLSKVTFIDIGSNIGYYALIAAKHLNRSGTVICIEPIRRNFEYLLRNIKLNKAKNVKTANVALSDIIELGKMTIDGGSNWAYLSNNGTDLGERYETVVVTTGDNFFCSLKKVDLIRMDVEGHEYNIVKGCYKLIKKYRPSLLIEIHPSLLGERKLRELLSLFKDLGYRVKYFIPRNIDVRFVASDNLVEEVGIKKLISNPPHQTFTLYLEHYSKCEE